MAEADMLLSIAVGGLSLGLIGLLFGLLAVAVAWRRRRQWSFAGLVAVAFSVLPVLLNAYQLWRLWPRSE